MSIIDYFKEFALLGAEWVLWLLVVLSVLSVGIMFERWRFFRKHHYDPADIASQVMPLIRSRDIDGAQQALAKTPGMESAVLSEGIKHLDRGPAAMEEAMAGAVARQRPLLEKHLAFLGTLGNNAPFIGLFGTVLGIIVAFEKLSETDKESSKMVMQGISEALVATAVGIMVAIPAVIAYNAFQRRVRRVAAHSASLSHSLLAEAKGEPRPGAS